jgi:hypothetical protein
MNDTTTISVGALGANPVEENPLLGSVGKYGISVRGSGK